MAIVGFNFSRISAQKTGPVAGKITIGNHMDIKSVESADIMFGTEKAKGVRFTFSYGTHYEPKIGMVEMDGDLLFTSTDAEMKSVLSQWKKEKKLPREVVGRIVNHILAKCNIQAIIMSRDVGLPPQLPLPKLQAKKQ